MHIGVDQLLQKINSNYIDSFEPEQLDWALNEEVLRFVKQRISPEGNDKRKGFQDGQKRIDDLKALIVPTAILPAYVRDNDSVFSYLPSDYLTLVNDRTTTKDLCGSSYSTVATTTVTKYITCLQLLDDDDLFEVFQITIGGVLVFDITDYAPFVDGLPSLESKFELINLILRVLSNEGYICKYGSYYDETCEQGIIIVSDTALVLQVIYTSSTVTINSTSKTYTQITNVSGTTEVPNRLTSSEKLYELLNSSFGGTIKHNPISTLEVDRISVWHKQKFIVPTINICYLKRPRKISVSLNQDCDLDDWIQLEIVDNTAKRLAGLLSSGNYKEIINENLLKE